MPTMICDNCNTTITGERHHGPRETTWIEYPDCPVCALTKRVDTLQQQLIECRKFIHKQKACYAMEGLGGQIATSKPLHPDIARQGRTSEDSVY